jgi:hypothetical protein
MIERLLGSAPRARGDWSQCREIILRVITHNVTIVIRIRVFYRASHRTLVSLTTTSCVNGARAIMCLLPPSNGIEGDVSPPAGE